MNMQTDQTETVSWRVLKAGEIIQHGDEWYDELMRHGILQRIILGAILRLLTCPSGEPAND
jgi:hypothetical protein